MISLVLSLALIAGAWADVPECVVLLGKPHERADMWLQGAQSEATRLYNSLFGGWLPTSCKSRAPRRRIPSCIDDMKLDSHVPILGGQFRDETCQFKGCNFTRFFPEASSKPAREWLDQAESLLDEAWNVAEALNEEQCDGEEGYTDDEIVALSCAAETIYAAVHKALAPNSPFRNHKFSFKHLLASRTALSLYETDGMPEPDGDENDFVQKQRSIESYIACCSSDAAHPYELQSVHLKVRAFARGRPTSDQQLLWILSAPISPFEGICDGQASNIVDTSATPYNDEYGYGDTTSVTNPDVGVSFPGVETRNYLHPETPVLAESTDVFWQDDKAGQLINVVANQPFCEPIRTAFAFFSPRTAGIHPHDLHDENGDEEEDQLIARVVVRERDEAADNCEDYDPSMQTFVDFCANCTWPLEGFPMAPSVTGLERAALCVGGVRHGQECDPALKGVQQCTATGACLKTKLPIFNGQQVLEEYVCHDWPKPGPNPSYLCKPNPLECPYGTCYDGDGAYPLFREGGEWYSHPDPEAVVTVRF